jgi:CysZ protein
MTYSQPQTAFGPGSFLRGTVYPLQAIHLFQKQPQLRRFVLLPILFNLVVGVTVYASLLVAGLRAIDALVTEIPHWLTEATVPAAQVSGSVSHLWADLWATFWATWTNLLPSWLHWPQIPWPQISWPQIPWPQIPWPQLSLPSIHLPQISLPNWLADLPEFGLLLVLGLIRLLLVVGLLLLTGLILLQFGVLLGSPWYGQLSEELEKLKTGQLRTIPIPLWQEISRAILYELKKLALGIGIGLPLLICNFFPGPGTLIATLGGLTLTGTIVCLDFLDSAMERRRLRFRQKLGMIRRTLPASAGFGLVCLGLVSVPLINLLAIPVCVAAGTLFDCDRILPLLDQSSSSAPES